MYAMNRVHARKSQARTHRKTKKDKQSRDICEKPLNKTIPTCRHLETHKKLVRKADL